MMTPAPIPRAEDRPVAEGRVRSVFTIGYGQAFPNGFVVIDHDPEVSPRDRMNALFGDRWSMQYGSLEAAGVFEFALTEVPWCEFCGGVQTAPWNLDAMDGVRLFCPQVFRSDFECQR